MNDEAALLQAIRAHPDEDTPRLAYADWLDESGRSLQAEFIRHGCQREQDPIGVDFILTTEEREDNGIRCRPWIDLTLPSLPPSFRPVRDPWKRFVRGFLYAVGGTWGDNDLASDTAVDEMCHNLPELVAKTTARMLYLTGVTPNQLARLLAVPDVTKLRGLEVSLAPGDANDPDEAVWAIASAETLCNLHHLTLNLTISATGVAALAATRYTHLKHIELPWVNCSADSAIELTRATWFRQLRTVRVLSAPREAQGALLVGLAGLPRLHTLRLQVNATTPFDAFKEPLAFPELSRLWLWDIFANPSAAQEFRKGLFPHLVELAAPGVRAGQFRSLLGAGWFRRLRSLRCWEGTGGDNSVVALSRSPVAKTLRMIMLGDHPFGRRGLNALASGAFTNLATLHLCSKQKRNADPDDVVQFVASLEAPQLMHLNLDGWPLGNRGAKALAANPSLANLTQLSVCRCGLTDTGFNSLVRSPHFQRLIELRVTGNRLRAAAALLNSNLLPELTVVGLGENQIRPKAFAALRRARGWVVMDRHCE